MKMARHKQAIYKQKIYKYTVLLLSTLLLSACSHTPQNSFVNLLSDGYKIESNALKQPVMLGFFEQRSAVCVYGVTASQAFKTRANKFFLLLTDEFNEFTLPSYVKQLSQCPSKTHIFVYLHESFDRPSKALYQVENNLRKHLKISQTTRFTKRQGLATITRIKGGEAGTVLVKINQLSSLRKQSKTYQKLFNAMIVEELFQAISNGNDISKLGNRMSILQEPAREQIPLPHLPNHSAKSLDDRRYAPFFKNMLEAKPNGLCHFDIQYLVLANQIKKAKQQSLTNYDTVLKFYQQHQALIQAETMRIENKSEYKSLFDPRCSGKNKGANTKIGIIKKSNRTL